ncbi:transposase [Gammaproteobacteria bacterium]
MYLTQIRLGGGAERLPFNIRNNRQFIALTGMPRDKFNILLPEFIKSIDRIDLATKLRHQSKQVTPRRKPGGGRKEVLLTPEQKLFFLLFYLKTYPTFDVLGAIFNMCPAKACENIQKLLPILKNAQQHLHILPHRHFKPIINNTHNTENKTKIIVDATERPVCRTNHARKQKRYYSGKKNCHALKNTVITNLNLGISVIGPTAPGSRHDYALFKEELDPNQPGLSSVEVWVDLGYQGLKDLYPNLKAIHIPYKKPRKYKSNPNPTLTPQQKKENRAISRIRVAVEHLIGDMKTFQILSIKFRNRIKNMSDQAILLVTGLCNLRNSYVVQ